MKNNYEGKGWRAKETQMMRDLEGTFKDLKRTGKTCTVDCINDDYIVELKARSTSYGDHLIEMKKMKELGRWSLNPINPRTAIYAVYDPDGYIYLYNISKLYEDKYDFRWEDKTWLPSTSHFSNNSKTTKKVGYINKEDAYDKVKVHEAGESSDVV